MNDGLSNTLAGWDALLSHAMPWTLVAFRVLGLFVLTPVLTSVMAPMRFKALLGVMLATAAYPLVIRTPGVMDGLAMPTDVVGAVWLVLGETLIGFSMGAIASIPLLMLELSGLLMGNSMGFGLARVYSPEADVDTDLLGQLLFMVATSIFLAWGGIEQLYGALLRTFERVPIGAGRLVDAPLDLLLATLASGMELGLRVASPVVCIVLLALILMGVVGKTMPQINIMTVGFTIKMVAGLSMIALGMGVLRQPIEEHLGEAFDAVGRFVAAPMKGGR